MKAQQSFSGIPITEDGEIGSKLFWIVKRYGLRRRPPVKLYAVSDDGADDLSLVVFVVFGCFRCWCWCWCDCFVLCSQERFVDVLVMW